jgi:hypothetical protein
MCDTLYAVLYCDIDTKGISTFNLKQGQTVFFVPAEVPAQVVDKEMVTKTLEIMKDCQFNTDLASKCKGPGFISSIIDCYNNTDCPMHLLTFTDSDHGLYYIENSQIVKFDLPREDSTGQKTILNLSNILEFLEPKGNPVFLCCYLCKDTKSIYKCVDACPDFAPKRGGMSKRKRSRNRKRSRRKMKKTKNLNKR